MGRANQRGPLTARIWLTFVVFCQIFLTPMAAFSITYLLQLDMTGENITIGIQREMLPWIMAASLGYGMLALFLALIMGGYQPIRIVERVDGWQPLGCLAEAVQHRVYVVHEIIFQHLLMVRSQCS